MILIENGRVKKEWFPGSPDGAGSGSAFHRDPLGRGVLTGVSTGTCGLPGPRCYESWVTEGPVHPSLYPFPLPRLGRISFRGRPQAVPVSDDLNHRRQPRSHRLLFDVEERPYEVFDRELPGEEPEPPGPVCEYLHLLRYLGFPLPLLGGRVTEGVDVSCTSRTSRRRDTGWEETPGSDGPGRLPGVGSSEVQR